jgi:hypothetical protein
MEDLLSYSGLARVTTEAEFVAQSNPLFLVKRPKFRPSAARAPMAISFETQHTKLEVDPYAAEWRVAPVRKREGNPYPDRFSIGRATNCDVVIRLPSVSKVHAHILVEGPQSFSLRDNQASNSTFVNGRRLEAKGVAQLKIGDEIAFGSLELEFVDAKRFYQILKTEVAVGQSHGPGAP